jgi:microcin C transport system substrate-binding protein
MINIARQSGLLVLALAPLCLPSATASAAQVLGAWTYAFSEYGDIKYPQDFAHYDFVNPDAPKGGTLRLSNPDRRTSFDKYNPFTLPETAAAGVEMFMFETLADASPDEPATMYGLIASEMFIAPDYSSISFRINPLAHFNNGDPVTAADVKYSFDTAVSLQAAPDYAQNFTGIRRAVVIDPHTVRFDLKEPSRAQIYQLGTVLCIYSRKWGLGADGKIKPFDQIVKDAPITTGAYVISRGTGQMLDLVRDPHYWATNLGVRRGYYNFEHLLYHYYSDPATSFEGFKAGDFELKEEYSGQRFVRQYVGKRFRDGEIIKRIMPTDGGFFFEGILLNSRRPQLSDWRVRSALNYSFDWSWNRIQAYDLVKRFDGLFQRTEFAATGVPSAGELALLAPYRQSLLPQVFAAPEPDPVSDTPAQLRANLLQARKLLAEAGWTVHEDGVLRNAQGEAFQLEILEDNTQFDNTFGRWAESLRSLGIAMRIRLVDAAVYVKRLDAFDFDGTLQNFGDMKMPSPSTLKDMFGSEAERTPGSDNYMGVSMPVVDHLIDVMTRATSLEELTDGARALDRIFIAEHFAIPFNYRPSHLVAYWNRFGIPAIAPKYYNVEYYIVQDGLGGKALPVATWWVKR